MSYDEILRYQNDLADLVCTNGTNDVPLPSHLNAEKFTTTAFDNFDHEEATVKQKPIFRYAIGWHVTFAFCPVIPDKIIADAVFVTI